MDLGSKWAEHTDPPIADLVSKSLHHDGAVVWYRAGGLGLLGQVIKQVGCGPVVEVMTGGQTLTSLRLGHRPDLSHELAERSAELEWPTGTVAMPERHLPGLAWRRGDDHTLVGDVLYPPGGGPEQERLAGPRLVDHLFVELAHPGAIGQENAVEAAVRDGAAAGHCQTLGAGPTADRARGPVPHDSGAQLGELVRRVAAGQQIQYRLPHLLTEVGKRCRPPNHGGQVCYVPLVEST